MGARKFIGDTARYLHIVVRIAIGNSRHLDQLGTEKPERVLLFLALGFGDDDHGPKSHRISDHGKADARVASRALDDDSTRLQLSAGDRILDDEKRGAILHRLSGIHELGFAEDLAARECRGSFQANERRIANGGDHVGADLHGREITA